MRGKEILTILDTFGISYSQNGAVYKCLCPFHDDQNNPSMVIFPDTNSFYCFTCSAGTRPEKLYEQLAECTHEEALSAVYGDDYVYDKLDEDRNVEPDKFYLNLVISNTLRENYENTKQYYDIMRVIDNTIITPNNFPSIINMIKTKEIKHDIK